MVVDELTMFVFLLHCSLTVFRDFIEIGKVLKKRFKCTKRESYIILVQTNFGKTKEKKLNLAQSYQIILMSNFYALENAQIKTFAFGVQLKSHTVIFNMLLTEHICLHIYTEACTFLVVGKVRR